MAAVVLLKAPSDSDSRYTEALTAAGFVPVTIVPTLLFRADPSPLLRTSLVERVGEYCCLVLTSPRTVDAVSIALSSSEADSAVFSSCEFARALWASRPVFAVGPSTEKRVIELFQGPKVLGADSGSAAALAPVIVDWWNSTFYPSSHTEIPPAVLIPVGNRHRPEIPAALDLAGVRYETVPAYITEQHPLLESSLLAASADSPSSPQPLLAVLFSPSGVQFASECLHSLSRSRDLRIVAFGQSTAEAVRKHGLHLSAVCPQPTTESLTQTLLSLDVH